MNPGTFSSFYTTQVQMALFSLIVENNEMSFTSLYLCPLSKDAAHLQHLAEKKKNTEALFLRKKFE